MPTKLRHFLAVLLVGLCAAIPLVQRGMPVGVDTYLHFLRMPHLDTLLRDGIIFTRWYPFMIGGYGYPLFNYYPPLGYYPIELLHLLGFSQFAAFKLSWAMGLFIAAGGAYLWGQALFSPSRLWEKGSGGEGFLPAITIAIAYTCSPFLLHELYWRGGLSQYTAHILLPYLFWLAVRTVQTQRRRYPIGFAITLAAVITSHNVTGLVVFPYLLAYFAILLICRNKLQPHVKTSRALGTVGVTLVLGLALGAWYWLPALLETDLIQVERVTQTGIMSYADNFQSLRTLFALPTFYDVRQLNLSPPRALHWGAILLGGVAWVGVWRRSWFHRWHVIAATGAIIFGVWMMLPSSEFVWQNLPLIHFLQFPFRFWGITTLLLAMLAGYGVALLPPNRWLIGLIWLLLLGYSAPWSFDEYEPIAEPTLADSVAFELESGLLGLSSATEYLPLDVGTLPTLGAWKLTDGDVEIVESEALRHVVRSSAETLTFNIFYFPGWQATIDGETAPIYPQPPHGLIALDLPTGEHTIELAWKSTAPRRVGSTLSALSVIGLITFGSWRRRDLMDVSGFANPETRSHGEIFLLLPLLLFAVVRIAIFEPFWAETTQFDGETIRAVGNSRNVNFGNQVQLIEMATPATFDTDETIALDLYWRPLTPTDQDLSVIVTLRDRLGFVVGESNKLHIGGFPTSRWESGKYILDRHTITLNAGTPPALYETTVTVYQYDNPAAQISVLDIAGNPRGETAELYPFLVTAARRVRQVTSADPIHTLQGVGLLAVDLPQSPVRVGETLNFTLLCEALDESLPNLTFPLVLIDENQVEHTIGWALPVPSYSTVAWRVGEQWRGRHSRLLPPDLAAGNYRVMFGSAELGTIEVIVPERTFDAPPSVTAQDLLFGDFARLAGYTIRENENELQVELVWRVESETELGYKSFVQLLDATGNYLAGSDQVPAQWNRPTTSWLTGEYIIDTHSLPRLENGSQLAIGLYDIDTLNRLPTSSGENILIIER